MSLHSLIVDRIRARGPITIAEYMELALYSPELGYYARAARRTGASGDFYTSVDAGPLFGELLARQIAQMWEICAEPGRHSAKADDGSPALERGHPATPPDSGAGLQPSQSPDMFDLVEAGAGNGRLSRDILTALERTSPACYASVRLHLVERSRRARAAQRETLGVHAGRLVSSSAVLPSPVRGVILANELLDALPTHSIVSTADGLREVYVAERDGFLYEQPGPLSTPDIQAWLETIRVDLEPGSRAEVNLAAIAWVREAARSLARGFLLLVDYGHEATELYSPSHAAGTLTTFQRHTAASFGEPGGPPWLVDPGERDITSHVDLTSIRRAAEGEGLETLAAVDQTYFLLGLGSAEPAAAGHRPGDLAALKRRLALKTLIVPGGLGSTHKVLVFGRGVGRPALQGCSFKQRLT
jgi:SAM-dependent MidA family methyltransferase